MAKIATIGAGGLGREIAALIKRDFEWAGYFDDKIHDRKGFLGSLEDLDVEQPSIISIGNPIIKKRLV